ncbi:MAG: biotin--[acetyl-CoA-carboxylase] ligase [Candidatus Izemoplasmatales bacterium]
MNHIRLETVDSTNERLKREYQGHPHLTVLSAVRQTAGRGRLGRVWIDDGKSALFSILLKEGLDVATLDRIPLIAAVALHKTLKAYVRGLRIKWPNDIVCAEGKLAGILCESVIEDGRVLALVVGFGVNANTLDFPDEIAASAVSLFGLTGRRTDPVEIVERTAAAFVAELAAERAGESDWRAYANRVSALRGERIFFLREGVRRDGVAGRIQQDGSLRVETSAGILDLRSGEVTITGGMKLPSE